MGTVTGYVGCAMTRRICSNKYQMSPLYNQQESKIIVININILILELNKLLNFEVRF